MARRSRTKRGGLRVPVDHIKGSRTIFDDGTHQIRLRRSLLGGWFAQVFRWEGHLDVSGNPIRLLKHVGSAWYRTRLEAKADAPELRFYPPTE